TYNLNATSLYKTGNPGIEFNDFENINLTANAGNNVININTVSSFASVNVNGWGGDDRFYIGARNYAANISGKVNISGGPGANNQVMFNDQDDLGADVYTLAPGTFTKTGLKYAT